MPQRLPARAETRVPVRVLPKARAVIHRAAFDLLADITLRLANDEAFEVPGDIAATLQAKGHVEILDGSARPDRRSRAPSVSKFNRPSKRQLPRRPARPIAALPEWNRIALLRLRSNAERDAQTGCLVWKGVLWGSGYGGLGYKGVRYMAHRLSWLAHRGPIPDGLFVCHSCDNRACIEISHLFLGTAQDNATDMIRKGRARLLGAARLTEADVADIKRRLADGQSAGSIAKLKSLSYSSVYYIKSNRIWRHVEAAARVEDGEC